MKLTTTIDVQLISKANAREHRRVRDQRIIRERDATRSALDAVADFGDGRVMTNKLADWIDARAGARATLSRPYHETPLDDDNIRAAFKAVRDAVAEFLGVDDGSSQLHFIYQQTKAARTGVKQSKPGWKKVKDKETGEVTRVRKVVKNVAAYDTRPTVTIEVMPVADIDPQVKRARELEAGLRQTMDALIEVQQRHDENGACYCAEWHDKHKPWCLDAKSAIAVARLLLAPRIGGVPVLVDDNQPEDVVYMHMKGGET